MDKGFLPTDAWLVTITKESARVTSLHRGHLNLTSNTSARTSAY
jgi:hypothetical protein